MQCFATVLSSFPARHASAAPNSEGSAALVNCRSSTMVAFLVVLWLLGMVSGYTIGAFVHVLLVIAVILILVQLLTGRRATL